MSNHYFQFKQFTIHQDKCAMKVSTDACIQGAWVDVADDVKTLLDIGTGTGLLSLMLAQRYSHIQIDAIEMDSDAVVQAQENIAASPWADRITVIHADATNYIFSKQYDMVICNPPFFNNSLLGDDVQRNQVRHTLTLTYSALFSITQKVLKPNGCAAILLPTTEHEVWLELLQSNGWGVSKQLQVFPKEDTRYNRAVSICTANAQAADTEYLQIYAKGGEYTDAFKALLQPFYLKL